MLLKSFGNYHILTPIIKYLFRHLVDGHDAVRQQFETDRQRRGSSQTEEVYRRLWTGGLITALSQDHTDFARQACRQLLLLILLCYWLLI